MALYTNDSKERVRDAVDMVDLVSSRVELKRAGANRLTGLCPFHDERSPSFGINPVEKVYHCFGCQASGDAFTFVMETEGLDFKGALEHLADRYKVTLELEDEDPQAAEQRKRRERLLELLERTATYYVRQLWESAEAARAREYLAGRGLQEATLREFRVGYAPSAWDTVLNASRRAGFGNRELYDAGPRAEVAGQRAHLRPLPLADHLPARRSARPRARASPGARWAATPATAAPKYVNSPESELFHKGRTLFAADLARAAAAKAQSVVAAEGYTDVIAMHQAGVRNAVGIMGTALTEDQIGELARLAPEVKLALDADSAGQEAMLRAARVAAGRKPPLRLRVVGAAAGRRPGRSRAARGRRGDRAARRRGRAVRVASASCGAWSSATSASAEGRDRVLDELRDDFSLLEPSAEREELARIAASRLDLSPELLESLLARGAGAAGAAARAARRRRRCAARHRSSGAAIRPSARFSRCASRCPSSAARRSPSSIREADLTSDVARRAAAHLRDHLRAPAEGLDERLRRRARRADPRARGARRRDGLGLTSRLRDRAPAACAGPASAARSRPLARAPGRSGSSPRGAASCARGWTA